LGLSSGASDQPRKGPSGLNSALAPDVVSDHSRLIALTERIARKVPSPFQHEVLNTLGALLYRAGRSKEAVERLSEGIALQKDEESMHDWLFLAMAQHRLGETGEAKKTLARFLPPKPDEKKAWDNLELELLAREAKNLIEGKGSAP
jgi:Flp pilus assembly protein TadD